MQRSIRRGKHETGQGFGQGVALILPIHGNNEQLGLLLWIEFRLYRQNQ